MYKDEYKNEKLKINEQIERLRNEDVARFLDENKIHNFELKPGDARKVKISDKETMIKLKGLGDRSVKYYYNNFIERYNNIYGEKFISAFLDIYENKEVPEDEEEIIREVREYIIDALKYNLEVEEKNKEIKTKIVISEDGEEKVTRCIENNLEKKNLKKNTEDINNYSKFARMIALDEKNVTGDKYK